MLAPLAGLLLAGWVAAPAIQAAAIAGPGTPPAQADQPTIDRPADDAPAPLPEDLLAAGLLADVNQARADAGLRPLKSDAGLNRLAQDWSRQLAAAGTLAHRDPAEANAWIEAKVTVRWRATAESVVQAHSGSELLTTLLASAQHRAQLLGAFEWVGIGVATDDHGALWATLNYVDPD